VDVSVVPFIEFGFRPLIRHFYQVYLRIQLGIEALNDARHNEAVDYFTFAVSSDVLSNGLVIHPEYEIFVIVRLYRSTPNVFHAQLRTLYSYLGGTWRPCGKLHTRICATHFFRLINW